MCDRIEIVGDTFDGEIVVRKIRRDACAQCISCDDENYVGLNTAAGTKRYLEGVTRFGF